MSAHPLKLNANFRWLLRVAIILVLLAGLAWVATPMRHIQQHQRG